MEKTISGFVRQHSHVRLHPPSEAPQEKDEVAVDIRLDGAPITGGVTIRMSTEEAKRYPVNEVVQITIIL